MNNWSYKTLLNKNLYHLLKFTVIRKNKKKGLEAVEKFICTYESNYYLETISKRTLTKLLSGTFKSFEEALIYDDTIQNIQMVSIILKKVLNKSSLEPTTVIKSIFVGE